MSLLQCIEVGIVAILVLKPQQLQWIIKLLQEGKTHYHQWRQWIDLKIRVEKAEMADAMYNQHRCSLRPESGETD